MLAINLSATHSNSHGLPALRTTVQNVFCHTAHKIYDLVTSSQGQLVIGFTMGLFLNRLYSPLSTRIAQTLRLTDPFRTLPFAVKIVLAPFVCLIGPVIEELDFREHLQTWLVRGFTQTYVLSGNSPERALLLARISAIFSGAVVFSVVHFANALIFLCNPVLFLPQVVATFIMGIIFGLAREFSGGLSLPIGMHLGNNILAYTYFLTA